ncbi:MAG: SOS response-associated peptidase, partial [Pseudomonadota bacterium]
CVDWRDLPRYARTMPGRYFLTTPLADVAALFSADIGDLADPGPRLDAAPGEAVAAIIRDEDASVRRMREMRWGMIPMGRKNARGRPVMETIVNARSETLFAKSAFDGVRRCILPVGGWYEWTGAKRRKTRWKISAKDASLLAFAAIWDVWRAPGGGEVASLATVTVAPNDDLEEIHHRMPAILPPSAWPLWLGDAEGDAEGDPATVLATAPNGLLSIRESDLR